MFLRGDDGSELSGISFSEDPKTFNWENDKGGGTKGQFKVGDPDYLDSLNDLQLEWLGWGHALKAAEHLYDMLGDVSANTCKTIPESIPIPFSSIPNPLYLGCQIFRMGGVAVSYGILLAATIAYEVFDHKFVLATLGEDKAIYGYEFSRATYFNTKNHNEWNVRALKVIRGNMLNQHSEMKQQLQERHQDIANHVGEDIADAQNALGKAIVGAQNQLGQDIVDAQNALGNYIVDAQNANGQAIVDASNYVTEQHNKLSEWLYDSLCIMFNNSGGKCKTFIGPLKEDQSVVPVELSWPEGQPTMLERLEQIQVEVKEKDDNVKAEMKEVKEKVDNVQADMKEVKDMMSELFGLVADKLSKG